MILRKKILITFRHDVILGYTANAAVAHMHLPLVVSVRERFGEGWPDEFGTWLCVGTCWYVSDICGVYTRFRWRVIRNMAAASKQASGTDHDMTRVGITRIIFIYHTQAIAGRQYGA